MESEDTLHRIEILLIDVLDEIRGLATGSRFDERGIDSEEDANSDSDEVAEEDLIQKIAAGIANDTPISNAVLYGRGGGEGRDHPGSIRREIEAEKRDEANRAAEREKRAKAYKKRLAALNGSLADVSDLIGPEAFVALVQKIVKKNKIKNAPNMKLAGLKPKDIAKVVIIVIDWTERYFEVREPVIEAYGQIVEAAKDAVKKDIREKMERYRRDLDAHNHFCESYERWSRNPTANV